MEALFIHCSAFFSAKMPLLLSVMAGGIVGSASHCSVMCAPLVAAQMMRLDGDKRPVSLLHYYHAGRIVTYMVLGVIAVYTSRWIFAGLMGPYMQASLLFAGVIFVASALLPRKTHACCAGTLPSVQAWLSALVSQRAGYFLRGMLMGTMPCGMVYAVLLMAATLPSPAEAAFVMLTFGMTTLPILQLCARLARGCGRRYPRLSGPLSRAVMGLNGLFLCGLGTGIVSMS